MVTIRKELLKKYQFCDEVDFKCSLIVSSAHVAGRQSGAAPTKNGLDALYAPQLNMKKSLSVLLIKLECYWTPLVEFFLQISWSSFLEGEVCLPWHINSRFSNWVIKQLENVTNKPQTLEKWKNTSFMHHWVLWI